MSKNQNLWVLLADIAPCIDRAAAGCLTTKTLREIRPDECSCVACETEMLLAARAFAGTPSLQAAEPSLDLDAIERRANAATPGPWHAQATEEPQERAISNKIGDPRIGYYAWEGLAIAYGADEIPDEGALVAADNAEFIAHARTDIPALIAVIRRLYAELDR